MGIVNVTPDSFSDGGLFTDPARAVSHARRLVAEGAESIAGMEVRVRDVEAATAEDVRWCDGLAVGSPTNMGILSWNWSFADIKLGL